MKRVSCHCVAVYVAVALQTISLLMAAPWIIGMHNEVLRQIQANLDALAIRALLFLVYMSISLGGLVVYELLRPQPIVIPLEPA